MVLILLLVDTHTLASRLLTLPACTYAFITQCEVQHLATTNPGVYFVALQLEDFASPLDSTPLSSVPLQFVAVVGSSTLPCNSGPRFVGVTRLDGSCIGVPTNTAWSEPITAQAASTDTR